MDNHLNIEISESLLRQVEEHCFSETKVEVGGFLLGKVEADKTVVTHVLRAKHTVAKSTQLTFTHKTWDVVLDEEKKAGEDTKLVGWYHSHPNFGVFLSDHDQFIQTNFFKEDGKVTIVVDPIRGKRGWFYSKDSKIVNIPEVDTTREKLGASSVNPDENIDAIAAPKTYVTIPVMLITSLVFSLITFGLGLLISSSQSSTKISELQAELNTILSLRVGQSGLDPNAGMGVPADTATVPSTPVTPAPSAPAKKAKGKAKATPTPGAKSTEGTKVPAGSSTQTPPAGEKSSAPADPASSATPAATSTAKTSG